MAVSNQVGAACPSAQAAHPTAQRLTLKREERRERPLAGTVPGTGNGQVDLDPLEAPCLASPKTRAFSSWLGGWTEPSLPKSYRSDKRTLPFTRRVHAGRKWGWWGREQGLGKTGNAPKIQTGQQAKETYAS